MASEIFADVSAVIYSVETDGGHFPVGVFGSLLDVVGKGDSGEYTASGGYCSVSIFFRAGVENDAVGLVETFDDFAFGIVARIPAGDGHYSDSGTSVFAEGDVAEVSFRDGFKCGNEVAGDAWHHDFGLRVAHTDVVLYYHRLAIDIDKTEEYESAVVDAFGNKAFNGRYDDPVAYFVHEYFVGERYGRYGAHAACVETGVAFANTLVILCNGEHAVAAMAVGEDEDGAFDAAEEFFDYNACGCGAELAGEHFLEGGICLVEAVYYDNAFPAARPSALRT